MEEAQFAALGWPNFTTVVVMSQQSFPSSERDGLRNSGIKNYFGLVGLSTNWRNIAITLIEEFGQSRLRVNECKCLIAISIGSS